MSEGHEVRVSVPAAEVRLGPYAARVPGTTPQAVLDELRRLLLAEHAMQAVEEWTRLHVPDPPAADRFARARLVDAAGVAVTFGRPFVKDDKGKRLDPAEWRGLVELERPELALLFDRLRARRNAVFAHSDTEAGMTNVTNSHKMFGSRNPGDPIDLRVYDVGASEELLASEELVAIGELAALLARLFSVRMVALGAGRISPLG